VKPIRQSNRAFGLMMAVAIAVLAGAAWAAFDTFSPWAFAVSGAFLVIALALPWTLLPLNRLWESFAHRLGRFNNFVLLGAFFYLLVVPLGCLLRLFGWDPMGRAPDAHTDTYWTPVQRHADKDTFKDMF
jgi:hypothetical protein